jgi:hypothetical protein
MEGDRRHGVPLRERHRVSGHRPTARGRWATARRVMRLRLRRVARRAPLGTLASLTLVLLVGMGLLRLVATTNGQGPAPVALRPPNAAAAPAVPGRPPAVRLDHSFTIYLVGSERQEAVVRGELRQELRDALGGDVPVPDYLHNAIVLVVRSPDDEARVWEGIRDEGERRRALGWPLPRVIDLRRPEGKGLPPQGGGGGG